MSGSPEEGPRDSRPFSPLRACMVGLLALGYVTIIFRGRHGPWFVPMERVTPELYHRWQILLLVLTLLVWPLAVLGLILISVWRTRVRDWRLRDLAIVEFGLAVLVLCGSYASYWLYESIVGFTIYQLAAYARAYAVLGWLSHAAGWLIALIWGATQLRHRAPKSLTNAQEARAESLRTPRDG